MTETFDTWLNLQMSSRGIRSARRFGLEAGLDPERVADWLLGTTVPSDAECDRLATFLKVASAEIRERRFPGRKRSTGA